MQKRKRISLFTHCFYPAKGGVEQVVKTFYDILSKSYDVHVFTGQGENLDSYKTFTSLTNTKSTDTLHRLHLNKTFQRICNKFLNKVIFKVPYFSPWYFGPILNYSKTDLQIIQTSDILIGFGMPTKPFIDAAEFAHEYGKELILLPAYHNVSYFNNSSPFQSALEKANKILFLSKKEKDGLKKKYQIKIETEELIHFGYFTNSQIETQKKALKNNLVKNSSPVIGVVGQIAKRKNLGFYKECIELIIKDIPNATFLFAGARTNTSPEVENELKKYIGTVAVIKYDVKSIEQIYKKIDIVLNPSIEESFGISNFEAMFYDKPVFVHEESPFADIVKESHLETTFSTSEEAAHKVTTILNNTSDRTDILKKQFSLLNTYSVDTLEKELLTIIQQLSVTS